MRFIDKNFIKSSLKLFAFFRVLWQLFYLRILLFFKYKSVFLQLFETKRGFKDKYIYLMNVEFFGSFTVLW